MPRTAGSSSPARRLPPSATGAVRRAPAQTSSDDWLTRSASPGWAAAREPSGTARREKIGSESASNSGRLGADQAFCWTVNSFESRFRNRSCRRLPSSLGMVPWRALHDTSMCASCQLLRAVCQISDSCRAAGTSARRNSRLILGWSRRCSCWSGHYSTSNGSPPVKTQFGSLHEQLWSRTVSVNKQNISLGSACRLSVPLCDRAMRISRDELSFVRRRK